MLTVQRVRVLKVTPTITAGAYAQYDVVGGLLTFAGATISRGGSSILLGATIIDRGQKKNDLRLHLFTRLPSTIADNAVFTIADAESDYDLGEVIDFATANYKDVAATYSKIYVGKEIGFSPYGNNLYGYLQATNAAPTNPGSVSDLTIALHIGLYN